MQQHTGYTPAGWVPQFADYLSLSFWTATAFSPTDVSGDQTVGQADDDDRGGGVQVIGVLVIARAVNIMK